MGYHYTRYVYSFVLRNRVNHHVGGGGYLQGCSQMEWGFLQPLSPSFHADVELQKRTDNMPTDPFSTCQVKYVRPDEHEKVFVLYRQKPLTANTSLARDHEFMTSKRGSDFTFRFTVDCLCVASVSDFNCRHHHKVEMERSLSWPHCLIPRIRYC
jgi:hypothetical protein